MYRELVSVSMQHVIAFLMLEQNTNILTLDVIMRYSIFTQHEALKQDAYIIFPTTDSLIFNCLDNYKDIFAYTPCTLNCTGGKSATVSYIGRPIDIGLDTFIDYLPESVVSFMRDAYKKFVESAE